MEGAIDPSFIAGSIQSHQQKQSIGAHSIFLGQVRADEVNGKKVTGIEYSCYQEMALEKAVQIREEIFAKFPLTCMHIYHSMGLVPAGSICFFVFTSSSHRKAAIDACAETAERIKSEVPIWGKEYLEDGNYQWKQNK